jgi:preprotein translocase subunit SecF
MLMLNKRRLHHQYTKIRPMPAWPFLVASLIFLGIGIYGLRQNNFEMIRLRSAVIETDKNNGDVEKALQELRSHVHGHMNTNLASGDFAIKPPIQLKSRYDRLATIEAARVKEKNKAIQAKAEQICAAKHQGGVFNSQRVNCITEYLRERAITEDPVPAELYKFDFVSPRWSPDLAGWSLLASAVLFLLFILRLFVGFWYKKLL